MTAAIDPQKMYVCKNCAGIVRGNFLPGAKPVCFLCGFASGFDLVGQDATAISERPSIPADERPVIPGLVKRTTYKSPSLRRAESVVKTP